MNIKEMNYAGWLARSERLIRFILRGLDRIRCLDFIAPLLLRLYLVPIFWMAGTKKLADFSSTVEWFGNHESGLGLPVPWLLVLLVALLEVIGAFCLLLGLGVRLISLPLLLVMFFAGFLVHWKNGWLTIAEGNGIFANDQTIAAIERLTQAKSILQNYGDYQWLTEKGSYVILNNGIEFAATYFVMLLVLLFNGGGRYVSVDYWLQRRYSE